MLFGSTGGTFLQATHASTRLSQTADSAPGVATLGVTLSTRQEVVPSVHCLQRVFLHAKPKAACECEPTTSSSLSLCANMTSHARTVVRECCNGDDEYQWERGKFDPPPPKNPLTHGNQNLCR